VEVGDPGDLEARIEVLSRDGVMIRAGARVQLEHWGGPTPLNARVRWVEPSAFTKVSALGVEEQRVYVIVDFTDPLTARPTLGDNYRVEARIETWSGQKILKAPAGALFQRGASWQTYVIEGHAARLRAVRIGHGNGLETEVLEGLSEGQRVIVYPGDKVTDGSRITPIMVAH
ncbi:MAG: RND transporter, partial [Undibacterium sp.]|nr:RND transporter [Opitutaceae bacterium]